MNGRTHRPLLFPCSEYRDTYRASPYLYEVTSPFREWTVCFGETRMSEPPVTYGGIRQTEQAARRHRERRGASQD